MDRQTGRGKAVRLAAACTECQRRKQKVHLCLQAQVSKVKESSPDHLSSAAVNGPVIIVRQGGSSHLCRFAPKVSRTASRAIDQSRLV